MHDTSTFVKVLRKSLDIGYGSPTSLELSRFFVLRFCIPVDSRDGWPKQGRVVRCRRRSPQAGASVVLFANKFVGASSTCNQIRGLRLSLNYGLWLIPRMSIRANQSRCQLVGSITFGNALALCPDSLAKTTESPTPSLTALASARYEEVARRYPGCLLCRCSGGP